MAYVTGATGFVGAHVVRALLAAGWRVRALARPGGERANLHGLDLEMHESELNAPDLATGMRGADGVFHVAAHYTLWRRDRATLYHVNVEGTENVLEAARRAGVPRVVYTSSVSAIGVRHDGRPADETFQARFADLTGAYKRSKYLAERRVMRAVDEGQDVVIVNPSTPLGPLDIKPTPTGEIILRFLRGAMPAFVDTGLNFVDVRSVAQGHLLAFERGRAGERYILGGDNLSLRELLAKVATAAGRQAPKIALPRAIPLVLAFVDEVILGRLGKTPSIPLDGVRMAKESMFYDPSKAKAQLGFDPGSLDDAIRDAVRWFDRHHRLGVESENAPVVLPYA